MRGQPQGLPLRPGFEERDRTRWQLHRGECSALLVRHLNGLPVERLGDCIIPRKLTVTVSASPQFDRIAMGPEGCASPRKQTLSEPLVSCTSASACASQRRLDDKPLNNGIIALEIGERERRLKVERLPFAKADGAWRRVCPLDRA